MKNAAPRVWFVAAGTGGHIFPGLSLAREIRKRFPRSDILFFGTRDRLEATLVPKAGFPLHTLTAAPWKGAGVAGRVAALMSLAAGFFQTLGVVMKGRPDVLVSVGGYVSVPVVVACRLFGVPVILLEPNIRTGLSNRWLSRWARRAFCAPGSDAMDRLQCPVEDAGNPVRDDLKVVEIRPAVRRVLVLGGSQGALSVCRAALDAAKELEFAKNGIELVVQSGEKNLLKAKAWQKELGLEKTSRIVPFIDDVPAALVTADVIVARAGALTISELAVAGLPTIFIPYPHAADDHQRANARLLAGEGAALMVDERDPDFTLKFLEGLRSLCVSGDSEARRHSLSVEFRKQGRPQATALIASAVLTECASEGGS